MISQGLVKFFTKKSHFTLFKLFSIIVIWGGIVWLILSPDDSMKQVADWLGIEDGFNAIILVGFIVVLFMIYRLLAVIESLERTMTEFIRQEALRDVKGRK